MDTVICRIETPDTLRFITDEMRYEPDTFEVAVVLTNLSDSLGFPVQALIDNPNSPYIFLAANQSKYKQHPLLPPGDSVRFTWTFYAKGNAGGVSTYEIPVHFRYGFEQPWIPSLHTITLEEAITQPNLHCRGESHPIHILVGLSPVTYTPSEFDVRFDFVNHGKLPQPAGRVVILHPSEFDIEPHDSLYKFIPALEYMQSHALVWRLRATKRIGMFSTEYAVRVRWEGPYDSSRVLGCAQSVRVVSPASVDGTPSPDGFILGHAYPNPFTDHTAIEYTVPRTAEVSLRVYDALGREAAVLTEGMKEPGDYSARFVPHSKSPGVYLCVLSARNTVLKGWMVKAR